MKGLELKKISKNILLKVRNVGFKASFELYLTVYLNKINQLAKPDYIPTATALNLHEIVEGAFKFFYY